MPLYEYQCGECGERMEAIQKFSDDPLTTCPSCGGPLERLISAPAIRFKGKGWYVNDYSSKDRSPGNEGKDKSGDAPSKDKKAKASKDSKKDTKASNKSSSGDKKSSSTS